VLYFKKQVEADPSYRKALIDELSEMDRSWSIINIQERSGLPAIVSG
jgi:hypothetical protein